jgi:uncharacterized protein YcnI
MTPMALTRTSAATLAAGALALLAAPVSAVNIPEGGAVTPDSVFVINFQVNESCEGAPTDGLEVTIPDVVSNPQPEEIAGWDAEVVTLGAEGADAGDEGSAERTVVRWSGGVVEEGAFQEFGLRARFPDDPGATIVFPVVQHCGLDELVFTEGDEERPAPTVTLAERFGPRDIAALSDTVAQMQEQADELSAQIDELGAQVGSVDLPNLRSRVSDAEDAIMELESSVDDLDQRLEAVEEEAPAE